MNREMTSANAGAPGEPEGRERGQEGSSVLAEELKTT